MKEKLKSYLLNDQIFYGVLIILIGCLSFYLGQLSVIDSSENDMSKIEFIESDVVLTSKALSATPYTAIDEPTGTNLSKTAVTIVASKNGTRYYLSTCSGAKRIKPENLITFPTVEEAKIAGYTKALNCPGL